MKTLLRLRLMLVAVLIAPTALLADAPESASDTPDATAPKAEKSIVEMAVASKLDTFVAATKAGGLVETFRGEGPFTIFAPTDEAFAKLPKGMLQSLLKKENKDQLVNILRHHAVSGHYTVQELLNAEDLRSLQGGTLVVKRTEKGQRVNNAHLRKTNLKCSNGVIHVIDAVMLPKAGE